MFSLIERVKEKLVEIDFPIVGLTLVDIFLGNDIKVVEVVTNHSLCETKTRIRKVLGDVDVRIISSIEKYLNNTLVSLDDVIYFNTNIYFGNNFITDFLSRRIRLKFTVFSEDSLRRVLEYYKRGFKLRSGYITHNLLRSLLLKKSAKAIMEDKKCCQTLKL